MNFLIISSSIIVYISGLSFKFFIDFLILEISLFAIFGSCKLYLIYCFIPIKSFFYSFECSILYFFTNKTFFYILSVTNPSKDTPAIATYKIILSPVFEFELFSALLTISVLASFSFLIETSDESEPLSVASVFSSFPSTSGIICSF